jgi:hypothetical protein
LDIRIIKKRSKSVSCRWLVKGLRYLPMPLGEALVGLRATQERLSEKMDGVQPYLGLIRQTQPAKIELGDQLVGANCLTLGSGEYRDESGDRSLR